MLNSWFFILFFMLLSSAACQYSARNTLVHGPDYCSTQPEKQQYLARKPHCLFLWFFVKNSSPDIFLSIYFFCPEVFFCPEFEN